MLPANPVLQLPQSFDAAAAAICAAATSTPLFLTVCLGAVVLSKVLLGATLPVKVVADAAGQ